MQWTPPPPSASVSPGTATASRPGYSDAISVQRLGVGLLAAGRHDEAAVADVEVEVRHGDRRVLARHVGQPRQLDDLEPGVREPAGVLAAVLVVGIGLVGHRLEHDLAGRDEGADVVDVAVRVVVLDQAQPQPDHALGAELRAQLRLDLLARERRVAPLGGTGTARS